MFVIKSAVAQNNKSETEKLEQDFKQHQTLTLHPVGQSKVESLEKSLATHAYEDNIRINNLDIKLQKETALISSINESKLSELDLRIQKEFNLKDARTDARLIKIEEEHKRVKALDDEELRQWRLKAMNGPVNGNLKSP